MTVTRRAFLKGSGLGAGTVLLGSRWGALAETLGPLEEPGASRASRIFPGTVLAHADLHNHSHLSDGAGDPAFAFASMRGSGLDVAALTDHSTVSWGAAGLATEQACAPVDRDPTHGQRQECRSVAGLDEPRWRYSAELADAADDPGVFAALRGFEWSSPFLGHVNVWFSRRWIDPLHTAGIGPAGAGQYLHGAPGAGPDLGPLVDDALRANPARTGMAPFYAWLAADPATPVLGGGADALAGFNHPGREPGRFEYFKRFPDVRDQFVSMEILNRGEDYLFEGHLDAQPSPLVECLNAGWRVGLIGVSDEHGTTWGYPDGRGRAGLWVPDISRAGVRDALERRCSFATVLKGLRVDGAARPAPGGGRPGWARQAQGGWTRMGSGFVHDRGPVQLTLDVDRGPGWVGKELELQVLRPADRLPAVAHVERFTVPAPDQPLPTFTLQLDRADGDWVVARVADPAAPNRQPGPTGHPCNNLAVAYTSPWWLDPGP